MIFSAVPAPPLFASGKALAVYEGYVYMKGNDMYECILNKGILTPFNTPFFSREGSEKPRKSYVSEQF